jgi:hypothetical protein
VNPQWFLTDCFESVDTVPHKLSRIIKWAHSESSIPSVIKLITRFSHIIFQVLKIEKDLTIIYKPQKPKPQDFSDIQIQKMINGQNDANN